MPAPDLSLPSALLAAATMLLALGLVGLVVRRNVLSMVLSAGLVLVGTVLAVAGMGALTASVEGRLLALCVLIAGSLLGSLLVALAARFVESQQAVDPSLWQRLHDPAILPAEDALGALPGTPPASASAPDDSSSRTGGA